MTPAAEPAATGRAGVGAAGAAAPDLRGAGTPEADWADRRPWLRCRPADWRPPRSGRALVVAPHPDDEVLGAGGALARLAALGTRLTVVAVTDGEASHPGRAAELRRSRPAESARAARWLGLGSLDVHRLGLVDSAVRAADVAGPLAELVAPGDVVLAPWWADGHPDHDECGRAARQVAREAGADLSAYLVWAWHWAGADGSGVPWEDGVVITLTAAEAEAKRRAAECFRSQLEGPEPVLPPAHLARLLRPFEVFIRP